MAEIIKTWPAFMERRKVLKIFTHTYGTFYFTLGRGKPQRQIDRLWFTHQGQILGSFNVGEIVCNVGQLPTLRSLEDRESEWQIKRDRFVAICPPPFHALTGQPIYHDSFRGFRYFIFSEYVKTMDAKIAI